MRTLYKSRAAANAMENNLIPMINIIFLLLIFFMIAGQISQIATPPTLDVPSSTSPTVVEPQYLQISINAKQQYYLHGKLVSIADIESALRSEAQKNTVVNLLVDQSMVASALDRMLALLRKHHVSKVSLLTHQAEQSIAAQGAVK